MKIIIITVFILGVTSLVTYATVQTQSADLNNIQQEIEIDEVPTEVTKKQKVQESVPLPENSEQNFSTVNKSDIQEVEVLPKVVPIIEVPEPINYTKYKEYEEDEDEELDD
jgi:hypothetical protein